jgi:hypothetical protein
MTIEQQNLIDSLRQQAAFIYDVMDDLQVDYDKYKEVATASQLKADQAQKVYDRIYKKFIYYPSFIKSLGIIKDDARAVSDKDQEILNEKYNSVNDYKRQYNEIIGKINQYLLVYDAEELAYDIKDVVQDPNSLTYSNELVDAADNDARKKAELDIVTNTITGRDACKNKYGEEVSMSLCRPSGGGGGGGGNPIHIPSAEEIIGKKIDEWIQIINVAATSNDPNDVIKKDKEISLSVEQRVKQAADAIAAAEKAAADKAAAEKAASERTAAEKAAAEKLEAERVEAEKRQLEILSIVNGYNFKVDVNKITQDKILSEKTAPSLRQQNLNYALCNSKKDIQLIRNYKTLGNTQVDNTYFDKSIVGTTKAYVVNIAPSLAFYLPVGKEIMIWKSDNIYLLGVVATPYTPFSWGGTLYIKFTKVVGAGIFNEFSVKVLESIEEKATYIINNPNSEYNGAILTTYLNDTLATNEEIAIARASCPNSDFSKEFYKIYNYAGTWNQYQEFKINDIVNYNNTNDYYNNGRSYLVIKPVDKNVFYYTPDNPAVLNIYYKEYTTQFFINNAYCNLSNGLVLDSAWSWLNGTPWSGHNVSTKGKTWEEFKKIYNVTNEQEKIAMSSCLKVSNFASFDGAVTNKKNDLTPLYYLIGGVSLFFIVKAILKKNK